MEQEAGAGSQPGQILNAKIETEGIEDFARATGLDLRVRKAGVKWLFRAS